MRPGLRTYNGSKIQPNTLTYNHNITAMRPSATTPATLVPTLTDLFNKRVKHLATR
jgi:hypothetical protein